MGLFDLFSNDTAEEAARQANAGIQLGQQQLGGYYDQGRGALTSNTQQGINTLGTTAAQYQPGFNAYADVSGAGGIEGLKRATDLYRNSGQYGAFGVANDAAQQAIQRAAAAGGQSLSGNVLDASTKKAQDLAMQGWGQFQQGLQPYLQYPAQLGGAQAGLYQNLGQGLNQSFMGQGNAANTAQGQIGANTAGATLNNYKVGANQLGAIVGLGQAAMGMPPTAFSSIGGGSGGGGSGGGGTAIGQTPGQPFQFSQTPIAQGWNSLFGGFS